LFWILIEYLVWFFVKGKTREKPRVHYRKYEQVKIQISLFFNKEIVNLTINCLNNKCLWQFCKNNCENEYLISWQSWIKTTETSQIQFSGTKVQLFSIVGTLNVLRKTIKILYFRELGLTDVQVMREQSTGCPPKFDNWWVV